jgi:hypothetical protein
MEDLNISMEEMKKGEEMMKNMKFNVYKDALALLE